MIPGVVLRLAPIVPKVCPRDGSPLRLDTEHATLVAREDQPDVFPLMWRCAASGHTVLDREPEPFHPDMSARLIAAHVNGAKGGLVIRRLRAAGRFYKARECSDCRETFRPRSGNQQRCEGCR